jgi:tripartite-type tricarboxylate transporter receptor subunit TctC
MLANRYVAGAAPDGYTLLLVTGAYPAQAAVLKELSFDPLKDISMISLLMEYPFVLVARPDALQIRQRAYCLRQAQCHTT